MTSMSLNKCQVTKRIRLAVLTGTRAMILKTINRTKCTLVIRGVQHLLESINPVSISLPPEAISQLLRDLLWHDFTQVAQRKEYLITRQLTSRIRYIILLLNTSRTFQLTKRMTIVDKKMTTYLSKPNSKRDSITSRMSSQA